MDEIEITPTSFRSASISAIELRGGSTTRFVFQGELVENIHDAAAPLKGRLIHQRKRPNDQWEDVEVINLARLTAGEGVRLELSASETRTLFIELGRLYDLYASDGMPVATTRYVSAAPGDVVRPREEADVLVMIEENADIVNHFFTWLSRRSQEEFAERLKTGNAQELLDFDAALGAARLRQFLDDFDGYCARCASEPEFQRLFRDNAWVLSQLFAAPALILQNQPYVGGKLVDNRGGNSGDYLYVASATKNALMIEIKRPDSKLFPDAAYREGQYRNNTTGVSEELVSASVQALSNRRQLIANYRSLVDPEAEISFRVSSPRAVLLIGSLADATASMVSAFEVYRNNSRDLDIVTFDELRAKIDQMLVLLRST